MEEKETIQAKQAELYERMKNGKTEWDKVAEDHGYPSEDYDTTEPTDDELEEIEAEERLELIEANIAQLVYRVGKIEAELKSTVITLFRLTDKHNDLCHILIKMHTHETA